MKKRVQIKNWIKYSVSWRTTYLLMKSFFVETKSIGNALVFFTVGFWIVLFGSVIHAQVTKNDSKQSRPHSHIIYRQLVQENGSFREKLFLHKLPYFDANDEVRTDDRMNFPIGSHSILGVHSGKVLTQGGLASVQSTDPSSGGTEELFSFADILEISPERNELLWMNNRGQILWSYDWKTAQRKQLFAVAANSKIHWGQLHPRFSLSPDAQKVAVCVCNMTEGDFEPKFDLHVIDLMGDSKEQKTLKTGLVGKRILTGAGDHLMAPAMHWKDDHSLLFIEEKSAVQTTIAVGELNQNVFDWETSEGKIVEVDVNNQKLQEVCRTGKQPQFGMELFQQEFWLRSDGEIMLRIQGKGDYRVDLKNKKLVQDLNLSKHFQLSGEFQWPSIVSHGQVLAERVNFRDISMSPDGREILWLEPLRPGPIGLNLDKKLMYHSLVTGTHQLAKGRIRTTSWGRRQHPAMNPPIHWVKRDTLSK